MLREMIRAEWERRPVALLLLVALHLGLPLCYAAVLSAGVSEREVLSAQGTAGMMALAALAGAAAWGSGEWAPERKGRWVHALSLPVGRVRLFALRYAAGAAWLAVALALLAAGSHAVAAAAELPPHHYAYPGAFTAWVALAGWALYTLGFVTGAGGGHPWRVGVLALVALYLLAISFNFPSLEAVGESVVRGSLSPLRLAAETTPLLGR